MPIKRAIGAIRGRYSRVAPLFALTALLSACASEQPVDFSPLVEGGRSTPEGTVEGRFRDLDAVVRYACNELDMAVVELIQADLGDRAYRIRTINDEPVWLIVSSEQGWDDPRALLNLDLSTKIGRLGDAQRERALMTIVRERLSFLANRDAP